MRFLNFANTAVSAYRPPQATASSSGRESSVDCITLDSDSEAEGEVARPPPGKRARLSACPSPLTLSSAGTSPLPEPASPDLITIDDD